MNKGQIDVAKVQRERCARRLKAVLVAEIAGLGSIDRLYTRLKDTKMDESWLKLADIFLELRRPMMESIDPKRRRQRKSGGKGTRGDLDELMNKLLIYVKPN
jgi:hypothetical protein